MSVDVLYKATAEAKGGRDGVVETKDGLFSTVLSTPKELGGQGGEGLNPEQLFAAGYSACFLSAMKLVNSQNGKMNLPEESSVAVIVGVGPHVSGGFGLDVDMEIYLPNFDVQLANALVKQTHQICPYSNAMHGNVRINFKIKT